jgi:hypothetical protein
MGFRTPRRFNTFTSRVENLGKSKSLSDLFKVPVEQGRDAVNQQQQQQGVGYGVASNADAMSNDAFTAGQTAELDKSKFTADTAVDPNAQVVRAELKPGATAKDIISYLGANLSDTEALSEASGIAAGNINKLSDQQELVNKNETELTEKLGTVKSEAQEALEKQVWNPAKIDYSSQGIMNSLAVSPDPSNIEALSQFFKVNTGDAYGSALTSNIYNDEINQAKRDAREVAMQQGVEEANTGFVESLLGDTKKAGSVNIEEDFKQYSKDLGTYFDEERNKLNQAVEAEDAKLDEVKNSLKSGSDAQVNTSVTNFATTAGAPLYTAFTSAVPAFNLALSDDHSMDVVVNNAKILKPYMPSGIDARSARAIGIAMGIHGDGINHGKELVKLAQINAAKPALAGIKTAISDLTSILKVAAGKPGYAQSVAVINKRLAELNQQKSQLDKIVAEEPKLKAAADRYKKWATDPEMKFLGTLSDKDAIAVKDGEAVVIPKRDSNGNDIPGKYQLFYANFGGSGGSYQENKGYNSRPAASKTEKLGKGNWV